MVRNPSKPSPHTYPLIAATGLRPARTTFLIFLVGLQRLLRSEYSSRRAFPARRFLPARILQESAGWHSDGKWNPKRESEHNRTSLMMNRPAAIPGLNACSAGVTGLVPLVTRSYTPFR